MPETAMNTYIQSKKIVRKKSSHPSHKSSWKLNKTKMNRSERIGRCAENLVVGYLKARGWLIRERNFETHRGEIDIIASRMSEDLKGYPTLAFIEVKSRSSSRVLAPETNVTRSKQNKIIATMKQWIALHPRECAVYRCDIAAVILEKHRPPAIQYFRHAFCERDALGW